MKIGVISDTHDFFDPQIPALFQGVEHILHGGDIGSARIIWELEKLAPVTAVIGNTDWDNTWRETEVAQLADRTFLVHHIVQPEALTEALQRRMEKVKPHVVIFGHTHKPYEQTRDGTLFFNPGYAGKQRFNLPRSVAVMDVSTDAIVATYHYL